MPWNTFEIYYNYMNFIVLLINGHRSCYVSFEFSLLFDQGQIGLNAAHMVMELIKDNRKIVDRISHDHINKFVELLQRDKVTTAKI